MIAKTISTILLLIAFLHGNVKAQKTDAEHGLRKLQRGGGGGGGGGRGGGRGDNNGGSATIVATLPAAGSTVSGSTIFTAEVESARGASVEFMLLPPSGPTGVESWLPAVLVDLSRGDGLFTLDYDFTEAGGWSYTARVLDSSGGVADTANAVSFTVGSVGDDTDNGGGDDTPEPIDPSEAIATATSAIEDLINGQPELSPKFVRLGFHDCVGGCDGCVDMTNADNNGLETPISALSNVVSDLAGSPLSRADIWALAALVGARVAQPNNNNAVDFSLDWIGRVNCEDTGNDCLDAGGNSVECSEMLGPHRELPSADLDTRGITTFFTNAFSFTPRETVALMGAHTLGTLSIDNSGFPGQEGWVNNELRSDNEYYRQIVGAGTSIDELMDAPGWSVREQDNTNGLPDRFFWVRGGPGGGDGGIIMLNADIALVRDFEDHQLNDGRVTCAFRANNNNACPYAEMTLQFMGEYRNDGDLWVRDFEAVFTKMLNFGYDTTDGCMDAPCMLPGVESSM